MTEKDETRASVGFNFYGPQYAERGRKGAEVDARRALGLYG